MNLFFSLSSFKKYTNRNIFFPLDRIHPSNTHTRFITRVRCCFSSFFFSLPLFSTTSSSTIFFYNYKRKEKKRKKNCSTKRRSRRSRRNNRRLFLTNSYAREDIDVRTYEEHMIDAHELDE